MVADCPGLVLFRGFSLLFSFSVYNYNYSPEKLSFRLPVLLLPSILRVKSARKRLANWRRRRRSLVIYRLLLHSLFFVHGKTFRQNGGRLPLSFGYGRVLRLGILCGPVGSEMVLVFFPLPCYSLTIVFRPFLFGVKNLLLPNLLGAVVRHQKLRGREKKTRTASREVVVSRIDEGFKPTTTRPAKKEPKKRKKPECLDRVTRKKKKKMPIFLIPFTSRPNRSCYTTRRSQTNDKETFPKLGDKKKKKILSRQCGSLRTS